MCPSVDLSIYGPRFVRELVFLSTTLVHLSALHKLSITLVWYGIKDSLGGWVTLVMLWN